MNWQMFIPFQSNPSLVLVFTWPPAILQHDIRYIENRNCTKVLTTQVDKYPIAFPLPFRIAQNGFAELTD